MPYMIYSQYKAAVADGYREKADDEVQEQIEQARQCRAWLASLNVSIDIRDVLVEQIDAVAEAFEEILRDPRRKSPAPP